MIAVLLAQKDLIDIIASLTVIGGILYAGYFWSLRPRLKIYFDKAKTFDEVVDGPRNILVKWVHVVVKNNGFRRADDCNGYILKIEKKIGESYELLQGFKADVYIHQHWANEPKGYEPHVIEGKRERRLDFFYLDKDAKILRLFTENQLCGVPVALEKGEYKVLIAASAKNSPTVKRWFILRWDGNWDGIEIDYCFCAENRKCCQYFFEKQESKQGATPVDLTGKKALCLSGWQLFFTVLSLIIAGYALRFAWLAYDKIDKTTKNLEISQLADRCMWFRPDGGDFNSYEDLLDLLQDKRLNNIARKQLVRVNASFNFSYPKVEEIPLCQNGKNAGHGCTAENQETPDSVNSIEGVSNVHSQLFHPLFWTSRVKAAYLLRFLDPRKIVQLNEAASRKTWEDVLDSLEKSFSGTAEKNEYNNLFVRYMTWEAFRIHTCFTDGNELFDSHKTSEWWKNKENKKKVLDALENGLMSPFCK